MMKNETDPAVKVPREAQCKQARPHDELISEILDPRNMKTEREHAAAREIDKLRKETAKLRAFAQEIMEAWPEGSGLDGDELQDIATKHGILRPETRHEPCREFCYCAEYAAPDEWIDGVVCYRKTALLTGESNG